MGGVGLGYIGYIIHLPRSRQRNNMPPTKRYILMIDVMIKIIDDNK